MALPAPRLFYGRTAGYLCIESGTMIFKVAWQDPAGSDRGGYSGSFLNFLAARCNR